MSKPAEGDSVVMVDVPVVINQTFDTETESPKAHKGHVTTTWAVFLIFRSLVGIGVLTMPHAIQHFGINGAVVFFPIFAVVLLYVLDLLLQIATDLGYTGSSIDELIEKSGNQKYLRTFCIMNNGMMIASSIVNCIFAVMFLNWTSCNMGISSMCNNKWLLHLLTALISLPFGFIRRMGIFALTSMIATIVILITINVMMGYQWNNVIKDGVSSTATYFNLWHFGEFFGVACFSIEGIGLILPIRSVMKDQRSFKWIFHITAMAIVLWYMIFGISGAMSLGSKAKGIILFIYGSQLKLIYGLAMAYSISIFLSFPMYLFPVAQSILTNRWVREKLELNVELQNVRGEDNIPEKEEKMGVLVRVSLILGCFLVSLSGINIIDSINLAGSILNSMTAFVFPILFYINYFGLKGELSAGRKKWLISIMVVGVVLSIASVIEGLISIASNRHNSQEKRT